MHPKKPCRRKNFANIRGQKEELEPRSWVGQELPDEVAQADPAQIMKGLAGHLEDFTFCAKVNGKLRRILNRGGT